MLHDMEEDTQTQQAVAHAHDLAMREDDSLNDSRLQIAAEVCLFGCAHVYVSTNCSTIHVLLTVSDASA